MAIRKHLVYFYRFTVPDQCKSPEYLYDKFKVENASENYKEITRKNGVLFIADELDKDFIHGRLIKIRVGKVRRIDIPRGKEWYESVKSSNGIEQEAHALLCPDEKILLTEYNDDAFKILPQYVFKYFREVLDCDSTNTFFGKLMLPEAFSKMIESKFFKSLKFTVTGELEEVLDELGFPIGKVIGGNKSELPIAVSMKADYSHRRMISKDSILHLIEIFKGKGVRTRKAEIITEEGMFTLLTDTLLNAEIYYDDGSDDVDGEVRSQLKSAYESKLDYARNALDILERQELDYYSEGRDE